MSNAENAVNNFMNGFSCSQAVFSTYSEQLGLDRETALKVSCAFGGGMARMGCTCGAVTGAYMLIGQKYGKVQTEDNEAREHTYQLVHKYNGKFKELYGSLQCCDLLGCDISTPEGAQFASEHNLYRTKCPEYIRVSAKIIEELLDME